MKLVIGRNYKDGKIEEYKDMGYIDIVSSMVSSDKDIIWTKNPIAVSAAIDMGWDIEVFLSRWQIEKLDRFCLTNNVSDVSNFIKDLSNGKFDKVIYN